MSWLLSLAAGAGLLLLAALDGLSGSFGLAGWLLSTAAGLLAVLLSVRAGRLPTRRLAGAALAVAAVALLLTAGQVLSRSYADLPLPRASWSLCETAGSSLLLGVLARRASQRADLAVTVLLAAATVTAPLRITGSDGPVFALLVALLAGTATAVGLLRRSDDLRTSSALLQVRNDERRDIARDLHDDLAHHVTGMLVTAQAAAAVADTDPSAAPRALRVIEQAAAEALASMRGLVQVLRDEDDGQPRSATPWPGGLEELVERFGTATGIEARLSVAGPEPVPAHRQAVQRVVQEALTNVGRHATGATAVQVRVVSDRTGLTLSVCDDGRGRSGGSRLTGSGRGGSGGSGPGPGGSAPGDGFGLGGGYGLAGVRERAAALGGVARAGQLPSGGWQVELELPAVRPDRP